MATNVVMVFGGAAGGGGVVVSDATPTLDEVEDVAGASAMAIGVDAASTADGEWSTVTVEAVRVGCVEIGAEVTFGDAAAAPLVSWFASGFDPPE